jgi:hypothetical protein
VAVQPEPAPGVDILIADDAEARWALRRLLEPRGYACAEAEESFRAVDLAMPGLDGVGGRPPPATRAADPRHPHPLPDGPRRP